MSSNMPITVGVDTHADVHVGVALDQLGQHRSETVVANDEDGYRNLLRWALSLGEPACFGVEGTGSFGAGLSRFLRSRGVRVVEVNRFSRQHRRRHRKHDAADAEAAARAVLSGDASGEPKSADGCGEMLRALKMARRSAVKARTQAANQLHALVMTAPERLRMDLRGLAAKRLAEKASRFRCEARPQDPSAATKFALRSVARRYRQLSQEIADLEGQIERLAREAAPDLVALEGVGPDTAATLMIVAGDNPKRLRSEAAFANLCGAAPIEASSGKVVRHRLNPHGNREANRALYMVALNRMRRELRTQDYVARRTAEGKSKREIIRCLKRYIAREVYQTLTRLTKDERLSLLGDGESETQSNQNASRQPPHGSREAWSSREQFPQSARKPGDETVADDADSYEEEPEEQHLHGDAADGGVRELRQEREKEQVRLGVEEVGRHPLGEDARKPPARNGFFGGLDALPVQQDPNPQINEVGGAHVLDGVEGHGRSL
jgi:transposase